MFYLYKQAYFFHQNVILERMEVAEWKTQCLMYQHVIGGQEKGETSVLGDMRKKCQKCRDCLILLKLQMRYSGCVSS